MMNLTSTSDLIRVITSTAAQIEVHASWVDVAAGAGALGRQNTPAITTTTTTTVVPSPAASTGRNVKHLNITNDHASASCTVTVEHSDGTTITEIIAFTLLPGENMIFGENGNWSHRDAQGAEYPPAGRGAFDGFSVPFMKTGTAPDGIGYWYSTAKDAGSVGAWSPGTPGVNGRLTNGTLAPDFGCIRVRNATLGANYLTHIDMGASTLGSHLFFDMIWVNSGLVITTTTAQAFTVPTLTPRDVDGTTTGEGLMIGIYCSTAIGLAAVASNATITYVNSKGVGGRTARLVGVIGSQVPATPVIGTIIWFNLDAGDTGVQGGAWALTLGTSWVSGSIHVFIARDVVSIGNLIAYVPAPKTIPNPGIHLYNDMCLLHCNQATSTTATFYNGEIVVQEK